MHNKLTNHHINIVINLDNKVFVIIEIQRFKINKLIKTEDIRNHLELILMK